MKAIFVRSESGEWSYKGRQACLTYYQTRFIDYLTYLDHYFENAKRTSEFNFIMCLLRIDKLIPSKYDAIETQKEVAHLTETCNRKYGPYRNIGTHASLYRYGLIVEGDLYYSTLMNLIRCSKDLPHKLVPFPTLKNGDPFPTLGKIKAIKQESKGLKYKAPIFRSFYDNEIRNAIFHSNYEVDNEGLHISGAKERHISHDELMIKLNSAFAFADAFMMLLEAHKKSYDRTKIIAGTHFFLGTEAHVIVRDKEGVAGLVEVKSPSAVDYRLGKFYPGEIEIVESGQYELPENKLITVQEKIYKFPKFLQKYAKVYYVKRYGRKE